MLGVITSEDPHGAMYSVNIPTGQHVHEELEEPGPSFRPVPVCNSRHGVGHAGAHLTDGLPQTTWKQLTDRSFGLNRKGHGKQINIMPHLQYSKTSRHKYPSLTHSVVSGGLYFSDWAHQWVSTYCFRMTEANYNRYIEKKLSKCNRNNQTIVFPLIYAENI